VPTTPSVDVNPFHLQDFSEKKLIDLCLAYDLKPLRYFIQIQKYNPFLITRSVNQRMDELRKNLPAYYLKHPSKFLLRLRACLIHGFTNKYYVGVFEKGNNK
jgi:hypothetical protein